MPMTQKEMVKLLMAHGWIKPKAVKAPTLKWRRKGKDLSQSLMVNLISTLKEG